MKKKGEMKPAKKQTTANKRDTQSRQQGYSPELNFEPTKQMLAKTARDANLMLMAHKKKPQDFEYKVLSLGTIKPSQEREDRYNDSSIETARILREWNEGKLTEDDIGHWNDFQPIVVDKHGKIIDGNHRYTAHEINGWEYIRVLQAIGTKNEKVKMHKKEGTRQTKNAPTKIKANISAMFT